MTENLSCPQCGKKMVLRTARAGRYRGSQFWGCTGFPSCKTIVNIESSGSEESVDSPNRHDTSLEYSSNTAPNDIDPRNIMSNPIHNGMVTEYFQACSVPENLIHFLYESGNRSDIRGLSQWRLDYKFASSEQSTREINTIIALAESILLRGSVSFCSPNIESSLLDIFKFEDNDLKSKKSFETVIKSPSCPLDYQNFDSEEEQIFWDIFTSPYSNEWQIHPQINLSSISTNIDVASNQRCDFLFVNKTENKNFIVEIDGIQHINHKERDNARDNALFKAAVKCIRVPASEVRARKGDSINKVFSELGELREVNSNVKSTDDPLSNLLRCSKFIHQLQVSTLLMMKRGFLSTSKDTSICVLIPKILEEYKASIDIIGIAESNLRELLEKLLSLYSFDTKLPEFSFKLLDDKTSNHDLIICPSDMNSDIPNGLQTLPRFSISDITFPFDIIAPVSSATASPITNPNIEDGKWFLNYIFRKENFWEGQWETVERALQQKDSVVLLPTGAGKSIAFQLSAILLPGRCIVVAPILALINDQIDNLRRHGIDRCVGMTSESSREHRQLQLNSFKYGHYIYCYVAPERFQITAFRNALLDLTVSIPISLIAIDEAHCVSEWGHDFRTSYLNIGRNARAYCESQGHIPPLIALTGTASTSVLRDTQRELQILDFDAVITPTNFDRQELNFRILKCDSEEKINRISGFLRTLPSTFNIPSSSFFQPQGTSSYCGIIFCPHVNGNYGITNIANQLEELLPYSKIGTYSGTSPRGMNPYEWSEIKRSNAAAFKDNQYPLLVATKAFGMGVDKSNIRYTVHIGLPESIESFYQEAGRAGRNKDKSECLLIVSDDLRERSLELLRPDMSITQVIEKMDSFERYEDDDIRRNLFFHIQAYRGEEADMADFQEILISIGDPTLRRNITLVPPESLGKEERDNGLSRTQKAIHRLVVIGVVEDYTIDYSTNEFSIQISGHSKGRIIEQYVDYISAYNARVGQIEKDECEKLLSLEYLDFISNITQRLVNFVYDRIEKSRRRSMSEMYEAVSEMDGERLRERVLAHLSTSSEYESYLEEIIASDRFGPAEARSLLQEIIGPRQANELRGSVARYLEGFPDNPSLLFLRSVSEILSDNADSRVATQNLEAALDFASTRYGMSNSDIGDLLKEILKIIARKPNIPRQLIITIVNWKGADREFLRYITEILPRNLVALPMYKLLSNLIGKSSTEIVRT